jgi:hypothetical protein
MYQAAKEEDMLAFRNTKAIYQIWNAVSFKEKQRDVPAWVTDWNPNHLPPECK